MHYLQNLVCPPCTFAGMLMGITAKEVPLDRMGNGWLRLDETLELVTFWGLERLLYSRCQEGRVGTQCSLGWVLEAHPEDPSGITKSFPGVAMIR